MPKATLEPATLAQAPQRGLLRLPLIVFCFLTISFLFPIQLTITNSVFVFFAWLVFGVQTIRIHIGLACIGIGIWSWMRRRRRSAVAWLAVALLAGFPVIIAHVSLRAAPTGDTIRLLSLNLRCGSDDPDAVLATIRGTEPDVICFQEYNQHGHERLSPALRAIYSHNIAATTPNTRGMAVYSRLPFVGEPEVFEFNPEGGPQIAVSISSPRGGAIRLLSLHLAQPKRFSRFARQRHEVAELLDRLRITDGPTVLAGDFNATNEGYSTSLLAKRGFIDSSAAMGNGLQWTWPSFGRLRWLRLIRLDHIFISRELSAKSAAVLPYAGSDHRPVVADIGLVSSSDEN